MKTLLGNTILPLLLLGVAIIAISGADAAVPSGIQVSPSLTNKPALVIAPQAPATVRITPSVTTTQLLAMPDATVVQSADGKQTITVGELRRQIQARDLQLQNAIKSNQFFTSGSAITRSPRGQTAANVLRDAIVKQRPVFKSISGNANSPSNGIGAKLALKPAITSVNNLTAGFIITPDGLLSIKGNGFGDAAGWVNLMSQSLAPAHSLRIEVAGWRDDEIFARVPPGISGVPDHDMIVQVGTQKGTTLRIVGKFVAAREEITVSTHIQKMIRFLSSWNWASYNFAPGIGIGDNGDVWRNNGGESMDCHPVGTDRLTTVDPGQGFVVVGLLAKYGRTDSGDGDGYGGDGSHVFSPGYAFGEWNGDSINFSWGVWRSHSSPAGWPFGAVLPSNDLCSSYYQISVVLSGPAGVPPF